LSLITYHYVRYVLIRALGFTDDATLVQRITAYTLIAACPLIECLGRWADPGLLIELLIRIIGRDQVSGGQEEGEATAPRAGAELPFDLPDIRLLGGEGTVFCLSAAMRDVAGALQALEPFDRELLVLYHIEGVDWRELADLHRVPRTHVTAALLAAEEAFVAKLRGRGAWDHEIEPDVHGLLIDLAEGLAPLEPDDLGAFVLDWLAEHGW